MSYFFFFFFILHIFLSESKSRGEGANGKCAAEPEHLNSFDLDLTSPALMAEGLVPPYAALEQPTLQLAVRGKLVFCQTIAVLCTDGGVQ